MRVSPVGYLFNSYETVRENAIRATVPSHNTQEAIDNAVLVSQIIFLARQGATKDEILKMLNIELKQPQINKFNYTCKDTIDVVLFSVFNSNNFEESIKTVLSYGGDTDTNACIVGSMAEALYGIPNKLCQKAKKYLPEDMLNVINNAYMQIEKNKEQ